MKRVISLFCLVLILLSAIAPILTFATELMPDGKPSEPSNVTITVVMPIPEPEPEPEEPELAAPTFLKVYPSDVTETMENGNRLIIKTYELNPNEKPEDIPTGSFERSGWKFALTDIIRKETANAETRVHTETVTLNTDTQELEKILPLLDPTMEYKAEDGFVGILSLDVASIKVETAGTKTSSYTMTVTREYPHLSSNDTSLVPKTVEEKGKTYTLSGVDWQSQRLENIDYEDLPLNYTAIATYNATGTSTKVTGYITTAVYNGTLAKLTQGRTVYIAYFLGEEIRTPLEMTKPAESVAGGSTAGVAATPEQSVAESAATPLGNGENNHGNNAWFIIFPILGAMAGAMYYIFKQRKGQYNNEKTDNHTTGSAADGGDGGSGSGGRLRLRERWRYFRRLRRPNKC